MITTLFLFMQKLRKRLTLTSILAGVSKHYACVNWQCWRRQFSSIFFIKAISQQWKC